MEETILLRKRKTEGFITAIVCMVFILSLLDSLFAHFRKPHNEFQVLRSSSIELSGPLPSDVVDMNVLRVSLTPETGVVFSFGGIQSSYWFGGKMWHGKMQILPEASEGRYVFKIIAGEDLRPKFISEFIIFVHGDVKELNKNSYSAFVRFLGIKPWYVSLGAMVVICLLSWGNYLISGSIDKTFLEKNMAEIYHVAQDKDGNIVVAFGLGYKDGIREGDVFHVFEHLKALEAGDVCGVVQVERTFEKDSMGICETCPSGMLRPGFIVRSLRSGMPPR